LSETQLDVEELAVKAQKGDRGAERQLFERLAARFRVILHHRVSNHDDVEDIMQEALSAIARDYQSIEVESSFAGWAVRVLQNRLLMYYRSRQSYRKRFAEAEPGDEWHPSQSVNHELRSALLDCVRKICQTNVRYARILVMSFQGFKADEICGRLKVTRTNAYSLLSRSRSLLELCLETGRISS